MSRSQAPKGLSLAVFVLTIVWTSVYLFNMVDRLKGIDAIGQDDGQRWRATVSCRRCSSAGVSPASSRASPGSEYLWPSRPRCSSCSASRPARAAAMALVGHGWAVTFGSMGSSYYTIQLVTGIEGEVIAPAHGIAVRTHHRCERHARCTHTGRAERGEAEPAGRGHNRRAHGRGDVRTRVGRRPADRVHRTRDPRHGGACPALPYSAPAQRSRDGSGAGNAACRCVGRTRMLDPCRSSSPSCPICCSSR